MTSLDENKGYPFYSYLYGDVPTRARKNYVRIVTRSREYLTLKRLAAFFGYLIIFAMHTHLYPMSRGITITTYLVNGNPEGIRMSYLSNWNGQAIQIPRNELLEAKDLPELNRPGVYFLIGPNVDKPEETQIYVGEANHLFGRIGSHMKKADKSFFELIIAFSSKDDNMTVSHTKYLEAKILEEAFERSGLTILNLKDGNAISLPAMVKDEMDTYFDNLKVLLPTMGYDLFKSVLREQKPALTEGDERLFLDVSEIKAQAKLTANGLLVLHGSLMKPVATAALAPTYVNIRQDLIAKEYVRQTGKGLEFTQDYEFSSPSQAGAVVLGYSVNGRTLWRNAKGRTLKEIEEDRIRVSGS